MPNRPVGRRIARRDLSERFWEKVDIRGPKECWNWKAAKFKGTQYGAFSLEGIPTGAHRVAYMLANGPLAAGVDVRHSCDNPSCVNPLHLSAGTHAENMRDMVQRGRSAHIQRFGEDNPVSKLTATQVAEIRALWPPRPYTQAQIAKMYGVKQSTISLIVTRKKWQHIV